MAENEKRPSPPYATFSAFLNFLNKLRDTGIPARIDPSVFGNASGSVSYSIISALKSLKLINADGAPSPDFIILVNASDEDRKPVMRRIMGVGYPTLWSGNIDVKTATAGQFDEHIRDEYDAKGSTIDKIATFFIAAANYADVELSPHLKARKPIAASAGAGKSKKQRKQEAGGSTPPSPTPLTPAPAAPLEYQLIDLLKDPDIEDDQKGAVWTLVQFLAKKKAA